MADFAAAAELGVDPRTIRRGALRTAISLRKEDLMSFTRNQLSPRRSAAQIALFLPAVIIATIIATAGSPLVALALVVVAIAVQVLSHRLALAAAARLGSERLPWLLYAGVLMCAVLVAVSIVEINLLFAANDRGAPAPQSLIGVMIATGILGTTAAVATAATAVATGIACVRRSPRTA